MYSDLPAVIWDEREYADLLLRLTLEACGDWWEMIDGISGALPGSHRFHTS